MATERQDLNIFLKELRPYKFEGFCHYTDFSNFVEIVKTGALYSRNNVKRNKCLKWDMRGHTRITSAGVDICDYVRFYYAKKPPFLYLCEGVKAEEAGVPNMPLPVLFIFNPAIALKEGVYFFDGDASMNSSLYYEDISDATFKMNWYPIFARSSDGVQDVSASRVRNAEFLCPESVDLGYVDYVVFRSPADLKNAQNIFGPNPKFVLDKNAFFNLKGFDNLPNEQNNVYNYLYDYKITKFEREIEMELKFATDEIKPFSHELKITYSNGTEQIDDSNYDKDGMNWTLVEDLQVPGPFELSYSLNGHRVVYYYSR